MNKNLPKLIVICGPTASGKSEIAVNLAQEFNGEIISADSRQIYQKMNIGTSKVPLDEKSFYKNIKHHLIDIMEPVSLFNVSEYKKIALEKINEVLKCDKVPFLVGGTGLYIKAVVYNLNIPEIKPNENLRKKLAQKSTNELFKMIADTDPETAEFIDKNNKLRLIRALEVFLVSGRKFSNLKNQGDSLFNTLQLGIKLEKEVLFKRIEERINTMIERGLESEVRQLIDKFNWSPVLSQTIGYQEWQAYFEGKISIKEVIAQIIKNSRNYAKRQLTWFKADPNIKWISSYEEAKNLVSNFLKI